MLAGLWQSLNRFLLVRSCLIPRHHPTTMPFGRVVCLGDRVRAVATTVRGDAWAKEHFPRDWKSNEQMRVEGRSVLVRWDDDGEVCKTGTRNVFVISAGTIRRYQCFRCVTKRKYACVYVYENVYVHCTMVWVHAQCTMVPRGGTYTRTYVPW